MCRRFDPASAHSIKPRSFRGFFVELRLTDCVGHRSKRIPPRRCNPRSTSRTMTVQEPIIARATAVEVNAASSILREAAEWLARRGEALWEMEELTPEQLLPHAAAGELWL